MRRPRLGLTALFRLCRKGGLHRAVCDYLSYTADYIHKLEYSIRPPKRLAGSSLAGGSAPEIFKLATDVIGWTGWPEAYVWDLPPGRTQWYRTMAARE